MNTYCWPCQKEGRASNPWLLPSTAQSSSPAYGTAHASSPAYVLSTSGTTGYPVIVQALHCSIVPNIVDLRERFSCGEYDVVFNAAPLTFDPSVVEVSHHISYDIGIIFNDVIKLEPVEILFCLRIIVLYMHEIVLLDLCTKPYNSICFCPSADLCITIFRIISAHRVSLHGWQRLYDPLPCYKPHPL